MRHTNAANASRWAIIVALVIATAGIAASIGGFFGPGSPTQTPASISEPGQRTFLILAGDASAAGADAGVAERVLTDRLAALGVRVFGVTVDRSIQLGVGPESPGSRIRTVLAANGVVAFVPLPAERYGTVQRPGPLSAQVGAPLPNSEPALFGSEGIASAAIGTDFQDRPALIFTLTPAAAQVFAAHTAAHVGEFFAILVDDVVASAPFISEAIAGGEIQVASGSDPNGEFGGTAAVVVGGPLPESWRDPLVFEIMDRDEIVAGLLREHPQSGLRTATLDVIRTGPDRLPVWRLVLEGEFRACAPAATGGSGCLTATAMEFVVDAVTGAVVESRALPE